MGDHDLTLEALAARLDAALGRIDRLEAENLALRSAAAPMPPASPSAADASAGRVDPQGPSVGRRRVVGALAGAAAGVVAGTVVGGAVPVAAADGDPLLVGTTTNTATSPTSLAVTGTDLGRGIAIVDNGASSLNAPSAAFVAQVRDTAFRHGLQIQAQDGAHGIRITTDGGEGVTIIQDDAVPGDQVPLGVLTQKGLAAAFTSNGGTGPALAVSGEHHGIVVDAPGAQLKLKPNPALPPAPQRGGAAGDIVVTRHSDSADKAEMWICVDNGAAGVAVWRCLASPRQAGGLQVLPTPRRIYDSRPGTTPNVGSKTPLEPNVARTLDVTTGNSTVPVGATAIVVSVLLVNAATGAGNFTVWAGDASRPQSNTLVWGGDAGRFTTTALTAISPTATVKVQASLRTDLVLDVVGYYR